jgi:hypothetical protein
MTDASTTTTRATGADRYADEPIPLRDHAGLVATFTVAMVGGLLAADRSGHRIPDRIAPGDIALLGVATFTTSRLLAKDRVLAWARAPFTRLQGPAGHGEVEEEVRGTGLRRALGELVNCPFCLGQWVAGAATLGIVTAPRLTRLVASMMTMVAVSDGLQLAYRAAEERASKD